MEPVCGMVPKRHNRLFEVISALCIVALSHPPHLITNKCSQESVGIWISAVKGCYLLIRAESSNDADGILPKSGWPVVRAIAGILWINGNQDGVWTFSRSLHDVWSNSIEILDMNFHNKVDFCRLCRHFLDMDGRLFYTWWAFWCVETFGGLQTCEHLGIKLFPEQFHRFHAKMLI
jgi:hypothetical protein